MVPPEGMGVIGVKESVTGTEDLPAMRSHELITKEEKLFGIRTKAEIIFASFCPPPLTKNTWPLCTAYKSEVVLSNVDDNGISSNV